jgi:branched-chain amino acid transport system permease protein
VNLEITGSAAGIYGIPRPTIGSYQLTSQFDFYYLIWVVAVLTIIAVSRLGKSRIGRAWVYIREDEDAAEAMGINRVRLKLLSYATGAVIGSLAGSLFAVKMTAIAPQSFSFTQSVMILSAVVLGGLGSISGVVIGAVLVIVLPEALRSMEEARFLLFGVALIVMMLFRPQGIWPAKYETEDLPEKEGEDEVFELKQDKTTSM